jgi:hypothetical protein
MKISPMPAVECALLHSDFEPVPAQAIFDRAVGIAREAGIAQPIRATFTSTHNEALILLGDIRIQVTQNPEPLAPAGFQGALGMAAIQLIFPDAPQVVSSHRANTFVTVGKGLFDPNAFGAAGKFLLEELPGVSSFTTSEEVEFAMKIACGLSVFLHEGNSATAFHWCMNDYLLSPRQFLSLASGGPPTALAVNPVLSSSTRRMGPNEPIAVLARGSQWLLGRIVCFEEERVPASFMLERLVNFIDICRMRGSIIPDGDTFGVDETEVIHVSWKDADTSVSVDYVLLTIIRSDEHGINHGPPPQIHLRYDNEGRILDIDADELPQMVLDDAEFEAELATRRAALSVPHPRVDLTALREIAMTQCAPADLRRPSLFSKLVSQFTRH